jgi:archaellum biogenesis ATPase FlaH
VSDSPAAQQDTAPAAAPSELKRKWAIYTPGELKQRCKDLDHGSLLIGGLIPRRTISIVAGDSGVGKSPLLYQAAICVAAGVPFLGRPVTQGPVLYLDFENGLGDVDEMVSRLSRYLHLTDAPETLLTWNYNNAPPRWSSSHLPEMIRDVRPVWVIIDSFSAFAPECEEKASSVTQVFQEFRKSISQCDTSITVVHHLRKPSSKPQEAPPPLEENSRQWFLQVRGSGNLINACDVRIGIAPSVKAKHYEDLDGRSFDIALVMGGFGRVRGSIPTTFVARVLDEDDEPLGYVKMSGASLLFNSDQEKAYTNLPPQFRFKEGQAIYGKRGQATSDFLKKCIAIGILRKDGSREYRKVEVAESAE